LKLPDYPMAFGFITTNREGKSLFSVSVPEYNQIFSSRGNIHSQTKFLIEFREDAAIRSKNDYLEIPVFTPMSEDRYNQETALSQIPEIGQNPLSCSRNPNLTGTDPAIIDVLVVYTPAAATWADQNEGGIANTIAGAMARTKAVVDNQRNGDQIRMVHSRQINYTELSDGMGTDLGRLTHTSDGFMDEVPMEKRPQCRSCCSFRCIS